MARWIPREQFSEAISALIGFSDREMLSPFQCDFLETILKQKAISPKQARLLDTFLEELAPLQEQPAEPLPPYPDNVIHFPVCQGGRNGSPHRYGGRAFETKQQVIDYMSDKDWRRLVQWESRHSARLDRIEERQA